MFSSEKSGQIILRFLDSQSKRNLRDLCELCILDVRRYLAYLSMKWPNTKSFLTDGEGIEARSYDVVGEMLSSKPGRVAYHVLDFFVKDFAIKGPTDDPADVYSRFRQFLSRFTRQNISRLRQEEEAQTANLKRRFTDILKWTDYESGSPMGRFASLVYLRINRDLLRLTKPPIQQEQLLELVEQAYLSSTTRTEWCRKIFSLLNERSEYRNAIEIHVILSAIVQVNAKYVDIDGLPVSSAMRPDSQYLQSEATRLIDETIEIARTNLLLRLVAKGRICQSEADLIKEAAKLYLSDLLDGSKPDLLPVYFRHVFPEQDHENYLTKYKGPYESVLNKCKEMLQSRLRDLL